MDLNRFLFSSLFNTFFFSFSFIFTFCWPLSRMFCFFCLLVVFVTLLCMRSESGCPLKNCCKSSAPKQNKHKESNKKKRVKTIAQQKDEQKLSEQRMKHLVPDMVPTIVQKICCICFSFQFFIVFFAIRKTTYFSYIRALQYAVVVVVDLFSFIFIHPASVYVYNGQHTYTSRQY